LFLNSKRTERKEENSRQKTEESSRNRVRAMEKA
jgi:hypothetical protein